MPDDQAGAEHRVGQPRAQYELLCSVHGSLPPVAVPRVLRTRLGVDPARSCAEHEQAAQVDDTGGSSALSGGAILRKAQRVLGAMDVDLIADFSPCARVMNLRKMDDLAHRGEQLA